MVLNQLHDSGIRFFSLSGRQTPPRTHTSRIHRQTTARHRSPAHRQVLNDRSHTGWTLMFQTGKIAAECCRFRYEIIAKGQPDTRNASMTNVYTTQSARPTSGPLAPGQLQNRHTFRNQFVSHAQATKSARDRRVSRQPIPLNPARRGGPSPRPNARAAANPCRRRAGLSAPGAPPPGAPVPKIGSRAPG